MKVIKRSGAEATFNIKKIIVAIEGANATVEEHERLTSEEINIFANVSWHPFNRFQ